MWNDSLNTGRGRWSQSPFNSFQADPRGREAYKDVNLFHPLSSTRMSSSGNHHDILSLYLSLFRLLSSNLTHKCTGLVLLPCWMRDQRDWTNLQVKSTRLAYICRLVMHGAEVSFWFGSQGESSGKLRLQCWVDQITNYYILYLDLSNLD